MEQRLTLESVNKNIEETFDKIKKEVEYYKRGMLLYEDCLNKIMDYYYYDGLCHILTKVSLYVRVTNSNYSHYLKDYDLFQKNMPLQCSDSKPWLWDKWEQKEANEEDKKLFFVLLDGLHISIDYFKPMPEDIVAPNRSCSHSYAFSNSCSVFPKCIDDGGLLKDPDPIGKTFRLLIDSGQEAVVKIKEDHRQTDENGEVIDYKIIHSKDGSAKVQTIRAELVAEGYIEGYTAKERTGNKEIIINLRNRGQEIYSLDYSEFSDDVRAHNQYPLWKNYFEYWTRRYDENKKHAISIFDKFLNSESEE